MLKVQRQEFSLSSGTEARAGIEDRTGRHHAVIPSTDSIGIRSSLVYCSVEVTCVNAGTEASIWLGDSHHKANPVVWLAC